MQKHSLRLFLKLVTSVEVIKAIIGYLDLWSINTKQNFLFANSPKYSMLTAFQNFSGIFIEIIGGGGLGSLND